MSGLLQIFREYKHEKIAVYGLGAETERVLDEIGGEFRVIGLLDGYREEGELYGRPVIPFREAVERQVRLIIVAARPGSCKAIARRVGAACMENRIALLDVRGKDLCAPKKAAYDFRDVDGITKERLRELAGRKDVVCVDLFDTLIMRRTLFPTDVLEMVDCRLKEKGIPVKDFCKKRLESEKYLARSTAPTLTEIYSYMRDTYSVFGVSPEELAEMEWSLDYGLAVPRQEMCDFIAEIYRQGKEVYIVSDTYYSGEQLVKLLEKCNFTAYTDVFASCEYGTGKTGRLFEKVKERIPGKTCLHIGDDIVADVESAGRHGIAALQVYSGVELLELAGWLGLWDSLDGLAGRIKAGMFVSKLFNSPFRFETGERKICVESAYDIGYLFLAPVISDFVLWFGEQVKRDGIRNIWFCARDGYLIKKLYEELGHGTPSIYFLTSRTAAIRAGVEDEEDLRYVSGMKFSGTLQEQLWERFGVSVQACADRDGSCPGALQDYSGEILDKAFAERRNYRKYIDRLDIKEGDIAFFDFVAKGTSQMYIQRLVENHLKGLYFLQPEADSMRGKGLDIRPFYKKEEAEGSAVFDDYYILETVLTSPEPSVKEFDGRGEPCYAKETRDREDIRCFMSVQKGILDYFRDYLGICPEEERIADKKLDGLFLSLIHHISVLDRDFLNLKVEDPFFNRMTDMTDLL